MGAVSNKQYPDQPEVAIDHNGVGHDVRAFIYDANGFKGVWTTDDRWIPENEIQEIEPKFQGPTCEGSAP
jgi:hypothetical protein